MKKCEEKTIDWTKVSARACALKKLLAWVRRKAMPHLFKAFIPPWKASELSRSGSRSREERNVSATTILSRTKRIEDHSEPRSGNLLSDLHQPDAFSRSGRNRAPTRQDPALSLTRAPTFADAKPRSNAPRLHGRRCALPGLSRTNLSSNSNPQSRPTTPPDARALDDKRVKRSCQAKCHPSLPSPLSLSLSSQRFVRSNGWGFDWWSRPMPNHHLEYVVTSTPRLYFLAT